MLKETYTGDQPKKGYVWKDTYKRDLPINGYMWKETYKIRPTKDTYKRDLQKQGNMWKEPYKGDLKKKGYMWKQIYKRDLQQRLNKQTNKKDLLDLDHDQDLQCGNYAQDKYIKRDLYTRKETYEEIYIRNVLTNDHTWAV